MRLRAAAAILLLSVPSCGWFTTKEPFERWNISVTYREDGPRVIARPARFEVHGPRGEILVHNGTDVKRGFRIDGLGVAAEIEDDESARLSVAGVEDGKTYTFVDHLNPRGPNSPSGEIVVDYIRRD